MKAKILTVAALSLFLMVPACDEDTTGVGGDARVGDGGGGGGDGGGAGNYRDFVANKYFLPVTDADAKKYGYDIDNSGTVDNALGAVLMALTAAAPGMSLQKDMDQNTYNGNVITLFRLFASDFTNDTGAKVQTWAGKELLCCAQKPCTEASAKTNCFGGTNELEPEANSPAGSTLTGALSAGAGTFGPGTVEVQLPIGHWSARVKLLAAKVEGKVNANGIVEGKLMGAISQNDLQNQVMPQVAKVLEGEMKDVTTTPANKAAIAKAFDTNSDGKITADEVMANAAVKAIIAGDVDADGDGKAEELSAGVGFTATTCKIKTP